MTTLKELKERAKKLRSIWKDGGEVWEIVEELANLPDDSLEEKPWPQPGDTYWHVYPSGAIDDLRWENTVSHKILKPQGIFRTRKEAKWEVLRREARAKQTWVPKISDNYWSSWSLKSDVYPSCWNKDGIDLGKWHMGNVHKTEEEAEYWRDHYYEAFYGVFDDK